MPDAYRSCPVDPQHLRVNIVAVREPRTGQLRFQEARALLFGFSASVLQLSRWSALIETAARRVLQLLQAMYVDDAHLSDLDCAESAGQSLCTTLFSELGTPVAPAKEQLMSGEGEFLGVDHDVRRAHLLLAQGRTDREGDVAD